MFLEPDKTFSRVFLGLAITYRLYNRGFNLVMATSVAPKSLPRAAQRPSATPGPDRAAE
jgi:hypothetical protein